MAAELVLNGVEEVLKGMGQVVVSVKRNGMASMKLAGNAYKNDVQALAPYKTGTYRRSIHVEEPELDSEGRPFVRVGTDLPYGRRLEFGFWDMMDSLGRHYYQYPRPHFRPPLDTEMPRYIEIMKGRLADGLADDFAGRKAEEWGMFEDVAGRIGFGDFSSSSTFKASPLGGIRPDLVSGASVEFGFESVPWGV